MMHVAHVGDSRCYRWREGVLEQLTHDHSLINEALEMRPNIDDAVLAKLPQNVVTRALGMEPNVRVSVRSYRMLAGDKYLLCSDGLSDYVDDDTMGDLLAVPHSPDQIVRGLVSKALEREARDNIAASWSRRSSRSAPSRCRASAPLAAPRPAPRRARSGDRDPLRGARGRSPRLSVVPATEIDDEMIEAMEDFSKVK